MAVWVKVCDADSARILGENDGELAELLDRALRDMVADTFCRQKDQEKPRKVKLDLKLTRAGGGEDVHVEWQVATVPAPYERRAEDKVADGQQSFAFDENGEIQE